LEEYESLDKGALLRREGLYSSLITNWRRQRDAGALQALATPPGRPKADPRDKTIVELERKIARLEGGAGAGPAGDRDTGKPLRAVISSPPAVRA
jgi:hypothetical protein